ncbi:MAG: orotate phosphoribosyltransferase [Anaerorhabdus sp.]
MIEVARKLLEIKAVFLNPKDPFTWASGIKSPIYCDNRMILSDPKSRDIVEEAFKNKILEKYSDVDVIVGTATAGIGHAAIIAHLLNKPMAYVRASAKDHGRSNQIEGKIKKGDKVVLIEDLISTGGSSIECVKVLKEHGADVLSVEAIFTYGMKKSFERFNAINQRFDTLTNLDELLSVASEDGYIEKEEIVQILKFRDNPQDESWIKKAIN